METLSEKIKQFNLLRLTNNMVNYIVDSDPSFLHIDLDHFEFVKFYKTKPYFYSLSYIEDNTLQYLIEEFDKIKDLRTKCDDC